MLTYNLDERNEDPLYVYLYKCIKKDIEDGIVHPHDRLPSKRTLARNLGVALITVESAYAQLMAEGYLYAEPRRGYFACDILSQPQPQNARRDFSDFATGKNTPSTAPEKDRKGRDPQEGNSSSQRYFTLYNLEKTELYNVKSRIRFNLASLETSPDSFPFSTWAKTLRDTLSLEPRSDLVSAQDCQGTKRLREAIAWHIRSVRGLEADPDCIVVGAGAQVLYNLIIQLLERPEAVALENPGYGRLASIYEANGIRIFPIPLDAKGISSEGLRACGADLAHITPSHQFPTGIVMPPSRRYELLAWATEKPGRYIIEDDYDCEFRLAGKPIPSLSGINRSERVIYTNTFSQTLGSAFRIAYMVLPAHLARVYRERMGFYSCTVPAIDQMALARFIEQGDLDRHINRTKTRCKAVRNALIEALRLTPAGPYLSFENIDSGLHFLMEVHTQGEASPEENRPQDNSASCTLLENAMVESLLKQDVAAKSLSSYRIGADEAPDSSRCRLVISYAGLSKHDARAAAEAISRALVSFLS